MSNPVKEYFEYVGGLRKRQPNHWFAFFTDGSHLASLDSAGLVAEMNRKLDRRPFAIYPPSHGRDHFHGPPPPHTLLGVGAVVTRKSKVLLTKATYRSVWIIPSGYVEIGESVIDAARREVYEETKIKISSPRLFALRHSAPKERLTDVYVVFLGSSSRGTPEPDGQETADAKFVEVGDILKSDEVSAFSKFLVKEACLSPKKHQGLALSRWMPQNFETTHRAYSVFL